MYYIYLQGLAVNDVYIYIYIILIFSILISSIYVFGIYLIIIS